MEEQLEIVKLFYCYDRKDKSSLLELEKHLKPLKEKLNFTTWWDEMMSGGTNQKDEIDTQLKESNIVLLFVSSDSLASIECRMIQQQAMELYKAEKIFKVIPIRIRRVDFDHEDIHKLQSLPKDGPPISERRNKDKTWVEIKKGIVEVVEEFRTQPQQPSDVKDGFMFIGLYPTYGFHWDTYLRPAPGLVKQKNIPDEPWLVSEAVGKPELSRRYTIFREKTVLHDFAKLPPTTDAIKQFADSHGHLGELVPLIYPDKVGQPESILLFICWMEAHVILS
jgi:hypothetical protein